MRFFKRGLGLAAVLAVIAIPLIIWWQFQAISDWWQLRGYTPPPPIAQLAADDTMTSTAKHDFYVNHPRLVSNAAQFRADCNETEKTIILGCYHGNQNGIYIYNVQDKRLAGVEQVTAAHEMLHAAYDRLSSSDKQYVDNLLLQFYNNGLHDQRIKDTINTYRQTEPNDVVNEMHSIFGTEVVNLPASLENYYKRYFTHRATVANYAQNYQSEFTSRQKQIATYDAELATRKGQINNEEQNLQAQLQQINQDRAQLDSQRASGQTERYNAGVPAFNNEVDAYNNGVANLKDDIAAYNDLVATRNAVASELASLDQAIDTRLTPQQTQ